MDIEADFQPNLLNSTVYALSLAMQIITFAVNYRVSARSSEVVDMGVGRWVQKAKAILMVFDIFRLTYYLKVKS